MKEIKRIVNDITYYINITKIDENIFIDIERGRFGDDDYLLGFVCKNGFLCNPQDFIPKELMIELENIRRGLLE